MKVKKFLAKLLLGAVVITSMSASVSAVDSGFKDVIEEDANFDAILYLKSNNIIEGYSDGSFKSENKINRAEFLKIVMLAAGVEVGGENCFKDVKNQWFAQYVCAAASSKNNIVNGYSDGNFKPEQEINFAEAAKMIYNTFAKVDVNIMVQDLGDGTGYPDGTPWYRVYVDGLSGVQAIPTSISGFDYKINRGEMAEMVWRIKAKPAYVTSLSYDKIEKAQAAATGSSKLEKFSSCVELKDFVDEVTKENQNYKMYAFEESTMDTAMPSAAPSAAKDSEGFAGSDGGADDYSSTNVQVEGVDEADIVKNDGKFIYLVKDNTVRIVEAFPPAGMKELDKVTFGDKGFYPSDMYIDGDRMVVLGYSYQSFAGPVPLESSAAYSPSYYGGQQTQIYIFDIRNRADVNLLRDLSFEGNYTTSRKVDDMLYVVMNKTNYYYIMEGVKGEDLVPLYEDSSTEKVAPVAGCNDILYYPWGEGTDYLILAGIDIAHSKSEVERETVLGSSGNVYASSKNLYVAEQKYSDWWWGWNDGNSDEKTIIHKFNLGEDIKYQGNAEVTGTILNQFSMDEYKDNFRIATTKGQVWDTKTPSQNNLYILNKDLKQIGSVEGIAPGEQIHSVRFMGDRAYIVTFKKIDPFFVIDVSVASAPKILGKLKIPGYSDYLHPYDENHIIGFGKDTATPSEEELGGSSFDFAWYQGLKVAMFDVTDVANPVELHKIIIGDRGTDSPLLYNHKALLFDKAKGIFAFPVTLAQLPDSVKNDANKSGSEYGDFVFQGAYVYDVSIENGFKLKGTISQYPENEIKDKAGYWWSGEKDIERILYIGDFFYTVSKAVVQANKMDGELEEVGEVVLGN